MNLGPVYLGDLVTFSIQTQRFDTGVATAADATPNYAVYEDETAAPILTGLLAALGSATGFYSEQLALSAANGFEAGRSYTVRVGATVNAVGSAALRYFKLATSSWDELRALHNLTGSFGNLLQAFGVTIATNNDKTGYALAVTPPTVLEIATQVWDAARGQHNTPSSFGNLVQTSGVVVATNNDKTGYAIGTGGLTTLSFAAAAQTEAVISGGFTAAIVDKLLGRGVQGGSDGGRTVTEALFALRNKVLRVDALATVFATNDVTAAWTAALGTSNVSSFVTSVDPA
jgi:hypothetical protein